jgi:hypothetical protein
MANRAHPASKPASEAKHAARPAKAALLRAISELQKSQKALEKDAGSAAVLLDRAQRSDLARHAGYETSNEFLQHVLGTFPLLNTLLDVQDESESPSQRADRAGKAIGKISVRLCDQLTGRKFEPLTHLVAKLHGLEERVATRAVIAHKMLRKIEQSRAYREGAFGSFEEFIERVLGPNPVFATLLLQTEVRARASMMRASKDACEQAPAIESQKPMDVEAAEIPAEFRSAPAPAMPSGPPAGSFDRIDSVCPPPPTTPEARSPRQASIKPLPGLRIEYPQPGEWDDDGPAPIVLTSVPPQADLELTDEERAFMADGDSLNANVVDDDDDEIPIELSEVWIDFSRPRAIRRDSRAPFAKQNSMSPPFAAAARTSQSEPPRLSIAPKIGRKTAIGIADVAAIESAQTLPPDPRATLVGVGAPSPTERRSERPISETSTPLESVRSQADGLVALLEAKANQQEISLPDLTPWPEPAQPVAGPAPKKVRRLPKLDRRTALAAVVAVATIAGLVAGWQYGQWDGSSDNSPDVAQETD